MTEKEQELRCVIADLRGELKGKVLQLLDAQKRISELEKEVLKWAPTNQET